MRVGEPPEALPGRGQPVSAFRVAQHGADNGLGRQCRLVASPELAEVGRVGRGQALGGPEQLGFGGASPAEVAPLAYRQPALVVAYPQPAGRLFNGQPGNEIFREALTGGEGLEIGAVEAHQPLGRAQPEVAGRVLGQGVNERLT